MAEPAEAKATSGRVIAGRYELLEQIAVGGMGTVWAADDKKLGRQVALKVMRRRSLEAFDDAHQRFEREAKAAAALHSAHVVAVHDYGVDDGLPFIAMELLEGESLKARLQREAALSVEDTSALLRQVVKGLKAAHRAGLVHRDLKPSNIFLAQSDDAEVVKLLDFGVVKESEAPRRERDETASGVLLGTPQYMSPEQARGHREIDHRADLWSLAVIIYEMITGENPFDSEADAVGDIVIRVCVEPITPPTVLEPNLPETLDAFFERALDRKRDKRFQSATELYEGFLVASEVSISGDISMDSMPVIPPGTLPVVNESQSFARIDDPSSDDRAMTTDAPSNGGSNRAAVLGLVAVLGVAALLAFQLAKDDGEVDSTTSGVGAPAAEERAAPAAEKVDVVPKTGTQASPPAASAAPSATTATTIPPPTPSTVTPAARPVAPVPTPPRSNDPKPDPAPTDGDPDAPPAWYQSPKPKADGT